MCASEQQQSHLGTVKYQLREPMGTTLTWKFIITKTTGNFANAVGEILNEKRVKKCLQDYFQRFGAFTLHANLKVRYVKEKENSRIFYEHGFENKRHMPITDVSMFDNYFSHTHPYFVNRIEEFESNGSDWQYHACVEMTMRAGQYDPSTNFRKSKYKNKIGSSYMYKTSTNSHKNRSLY
jgi:hypothetical protein